MSKDYGKLFLYNRAFRFRVTWAALMVIVALMLLGHPSIAVSWAITVTVFIELAARRLYRSPKREIGPDFTALRYLYEYDD